MASDFPEKVWLANYSMRPEDPFPIFTEERATAYGQGTNFEVSQPYFSASLVEEMLKSMEEDAQVMHDLSRHPLCQSVFFAKCTYGGCAARRKRIDEFKAQSSLGAMESVAKEMIRRSNAAQNLKAGNAYAAAAHLRRLEIESAAVSESAPGLSDEERAQLLRLANIIGGVHRPCADLQLHEDDARFLRNLASRECRGEEVKKLRVERQHWLDEDVKKSKRLDKLEALNVEVSCPDCQPQDKGLTKDDGERLGSIATSIEKTFELLGAPVTDHVSRDLRYLRQLSRTALQQGGGEGG